MEKNSKDIKETKVKCNCNGEHKCGDNCKCKKDLKEQSKNKK